MRYDPATRILSLSFTRRPGEHVDVMLETGRRMVTGPDLPAGSRVRIVASDGSDLRVEAG